MYQPDYPGHKARSRRTGGIKDDSVDEVDGKNYSKVRVRGTNKGGLAMLFHSIPPFVIFRVSVEIALRKSEVPFPPSLPD